MPRLRISIWILFFGVLFSPLAFETNVFPLNKTKNRNIDDKSEQAEMWSQKGVVFYGKKEYKAAIECFQKAVKLNAEEVRYIINLVRTYLKIEKFAEAEKSIYKALKEITKKEDQKSLKIEIADVHFL